MPTTPVALDASGVHAPMLMPDAASFTLVGFSPRLAAPTPRTSQERQRGTEKADGHPERAERAERRNWLCGSAQTPKSLQEDPRIVNWIVPTIGHHHSEVMRDRKRIQRSGGGQLY